MSIVQRSIGYAVAIAALSQAAACGGKGFLRVGGVTDHHVNGEADDADPNTGPRARFPPGNSAKDGNTTCKATIEIGNPNAAVVDVTVTPSRSSSGSLPKAAASNQFDADATVQGNANKILPYRLDVRQIKVDGARVVKINLILTAKTPATVGTISGFAEYEFVEKRGEPDKIEIFLDRHKIKEIPDMGSFQDDQNVSLSEVLTEGHNPVKMHMLVTVEADTFVTLTAAASFPKK